MRRCPPATVAANSVVHARSRGVHAFCVAFACPQIHTRRRSNTAVQFLNKTASDADIFKSSRSSNCLFLPVVCAGAAGWVHWPRMGLEDAGLGGKPETRHNPFELVKLTFGSKIFEAVPGERIGAELAQHREAALSLLPDRNIPEPNLDFSSPDALQRSLDDILVAAKSGRDVPTVLGLNVALEAHACDPVRQISVHAIEKAQLNLAGRLAKVHVLRKADKKAQTQLRQRCAVAKGTTTVRYSDIDGAAQLLTILAQQNIPAVKAVLRLTAAGYSWRAVCPPAAASVQASVSKGDDGTKVEGQPVAAAASEQTNPGDAKCSKDERLSVDAAAPAHEPGSRGDGKGAKAKKQAAAASVQDPANKGDAKGSRAELEAPVFKPVKGEECGAEFEVTMDVRGVLIPPQKTEEFEATQDGSATELFEQIAALWHHLTREWDTYAIVLPLSGCWPARMLELCFKLMNLLHCDKRGVVAVVQWADEASKRVKITLAETNADQHHAWLMNSPSVVRQANAKKNHVKDLDESELLRRRFDAIVAASRHVLDKMGADRMENIFDSMVSNVSDHCRKNPKRYAHYSTNLNSLNLGMDNCGSYDV
eukprot:350494-Chlamydomonas_euryale.AAC.15